MAFVGDVDVGGVVVAKLTMVLVVTTMVLDGV